MISGFLRAQRAPFFTSSSWTLLFSSTRPFTKKDSNTFIFRNYAMQKDKYPEVIKIDAQDKVIREKEAT